ncbi:cupin [Stappia sp. F7233]|uniref:Cupin n=1 Tax=Stappia albiluteola TaxID=2758565 RepID=A0A839AJS3_9HYPH|nr:cupin domain-containing protein [Stappia albiluteola]MBA5779278.1 cupin [Stappia albiluteola]
MPKLNLAALMAAATVGIVAGPALAAECPADQVLKEPRQIENAPDIGVERPVIGMVDLTGWRGQGNFYLRLRRLTVAPGGVVPTHWHDDRPSIVHIAEGEIIEHNVHCAVPIVHKAGDTTPEFGEGHGHWWENKTDKTVVLFSTDVVPFEKKEEPHM